MERHSPPSRPIANRPHIIRKDHLRGLSKASAPGMPCAAPCNASWAPGSDAKRQRASRHAAPTCNKAARAELEQVPRNSPDKPG